LSLETKYLQDLFNQINDLHTRHDIKTLLRKCVYCILVDEDSNEEILFLNEVKKLLNEIKSSTSVDHLEIISVINEIYLFAVDKKIDENNQVEPKENAIADELLSLFEVHQNLVQEEADDDDFEFEEECGEDENNNNQQEESENENENKEDSDDGFGDNDEGQPPVWRSY